MQNEFNFLNKIYNDEEGLAIALHENFGDAINYVFSEKFVAGIGDSYLKGRVLVELNRCKYAESALTMIINLLNPAIGLSVRGNSFKSLKDLATYMYNDDKLHTTILHLFNDHCLSEAFGDSLEAKEKEKLIEIERNINEPAIYYLFQLIYKDNKEIIDYHGLSKYDYYFYAMSNSRDPFLTYYNVLNNLTFKADLMRNISIDRILDCYTKENMPYLILRDLVPNLKLDTSCLLNSGIHFWVAANLKHYKAKGLAAKVKKAMKKTLKKVKKPNIIETKYALADKMYSYYNLFIKLWDLGLVKAKAPEYALDKEHSLRVCEAYNLETKCEAEVSFIEACELSKKDKESELKHLEKQFKEIKKN